MENCKYCNEPVGGNYCANCGQPVKLKKIDRGYIIHEIADVFNVNNKMFFTIKSLFANPGKSVKHYIAEDRSPFVRPISFIFINSLIFTLIHYFFPVNINDYMSMVQVEEMDVAELDVAQSFSKWIFENTGYITLFTGLFTAFWVRIFFRKAGYNLYEIFTLLCFVCGLLLLLEAFLVFLQAVTPWRLLQIMYVVDPLFITWAVGQFFDSRKAMSYVKALLSYLFGFLILTVLIIIVMAVLVMHNSQ